MIISASQIRAARALIKWSATDLANATGLGISTIQRMENKGTENISIASYDIAIACLESQGIVFVNDSEAEDTIGQPTRPKMYGSGVRLYAPESEVREVAKNLLSAGITFDSTEWILPIDTQEFNKYMNLIENIIDQEINTNNYWYLRVINKTGPKRTDIESKGVAIYDVNWHTEEEISAYVNWTGFFTISDFLEKSRLASKEDIYSKPDTRYEGNEIPF
ncbi:helix-turn-helix domain-containing protein [Kiloniella majae]|uniref:helix-turn-helix domain-containing protein n=1 Tax=Kiloniella majae TaxID=1938558 RepID=UPI000A2796D7|nr:helix-turn-helix transcriptional regulator [Kiloniella majae]